MGPITIVETKHRLLRWIEPSDAGPTARDVMSAPAMACREHAFFEEVAEILAGRHISGLPVIDADGIVVGVISERDLAHALGGPMVRLVLRRPNHGRGFEDLHEIPRDRRRAARVMSAPAITAGPDAPLPELARLMKVHDVNRLPVVDGGRRLIGVVTRGDLLGVIAQLRHGEIDLTDPPLVVGRGGSDAGIMT
ncbi:MAG: CBS domain-containing protein [Actinomycetota bacterium]